MSVVGSLREIRRRETAAGDLHFRLGFSIIMAGFAHTQGKGDMDWTSRIRMNWNSRILPDKLP